MHQIRFVHVDRGAVMEQRDENRQAHRGLSGGDGHDEEDEDESVELMELPGVCEEREVHRVHHQFDAHEDRDAVPAGEHAADAEREEDGAEDEKPVRRNHGASGRAGSGERRAGSVAASLVRAPPPVRALRSSAPTIAASSRIDTASNGKMYDSKSATPMARASAWNGVFGSCRTAYLPR